MKIENSLNPNCSEAVFRFYTLEPKEIQAILQAIADEISVEEGDQIPDWKDQKIPLLKTAKEYETKRNKMAGKEWQAHIARMGKINQLKEKGNITEKERGKRMDKELADWQKKKYPERALLYGCAGLGDNEAVITIEKDAFVLNIGNNSISDNKTSWVEAVRAMVKVRYAGDGTKEGDKLEKDFARDCCCGATYGFGYEKGALISGV